MNPTNTLDIYKDSNTLKAMLSAVNDAALYVRKFMNQHQIGQSDLRTVDKPNDLIENDVVTFMDTEVERRIFAELNEKFPHIKTRGEESADTSKDAVKGDMRWVLDPIDGTKNLALGSDEFVISLALQKFDGENWDTLEGVIARPMNDKIIWAAKGKGAYIREPVYQEDGSLGSRERIMRAVPKKYKSETPDDDEILGNRAIDLSLPRASLPLLKPVREAIEGNNSYRFGSIKSINSIATTFSMLGNGRQAIIAGGLEIYDKTAGLLFAEEMGMHTRTIVLKTPDQDKESTPVHKEVHIIAEDKFLFDKLVSITRQAMRETGLAGLVQLVR